MQKQRLQPQLNIQMEDIDLFSIFVSHAVTYQASRFQTQERSMQLVLQNREREVIHKALIIIAMNTTGTKD